MQHVVKRSDYEPPRYEVLTTELWFTLHEKQTLVRAKLLLKRLPGAAPDATLRLDGEKLKLKSIKLDGRALEPQDFHVDEHSLSLTRFPIQATLETECEIDPASNLAFNGLFLSNGNFFTQCEAEGFRRITYFPDRPDTMSRYRVYLEAPKQLYPVLLSNGNLLDQGEVSAREGWHWALWDDPFPKPSYLFALVAGNFVVNQQTLLRASGRPALLQVWVQPGNEDKTQHAMDSLVRAIRWDEHRYGLELDLDRFMIVASADFNMGAMENKGLNIFNTKYVFANPKIATDLDFEGVEAVVGHEYFHNWTGNRVTCRDWFQLTLKEGLTVFRDQEFTADQMASLSTNQSLAASARAVKRIDDVRVLRASQFTEDAGPMAHPIRPEEYSEINNFYTVTVYEKGAEVIRMLQTLLGATGFRRGMDVYFARHDGQAVTCDDFVAAMADANHVPLEQFKRWYAQAGTPHLEVSWTYSPEPGNEQGGGQLTVHFTQHLPIHPSTGQVRAPGLALMIPIVLGALGDDGMDLLQENTLFVLNDLQASVSYFVSRKPKALSVLRNFSAPVLLDVKQEASSLSFLAQHDTDPFNRWDAVQQLAVKAVLEAYVQIDPARAVATAGLAPSLSELSNALTLALAQPHLDPSYLAALLSPPSEGFIGEQVNDLDPAHLRRARNAVLAAIATALHLGLEACYRNTLSVEPFNSTPAEVGRRALRNSCLALLSQVPHLADQVNEWARQQFFGSDNMTEQWGALSAVINTPLSARAALLDAIEEKFVSEALVLDKWYTALATSHVPQTPADRDVLASVQALGRRKDFSLKNPNRARALVHSFCGANPAEFHRPDGAGYRFWEESVLAIDRANPQSAARLARALDRWTKLSPTLREQAKLSLQRLDAQTSLSGDVREVIAKALSNSSSSTSE
jgi:aminopeptidase N